MARLCSFISFLLFALAVPAILLTCNIDISATAAPVVSIIYNSTIHGVSNSALKRYDVAKDFPAQDPNIKMVGGSITTVNAVSATHSGYDPVKRVCAHSTLIYSCI